MGPETPFSTFQDEAFTAMKYQPRRQLNKKKTIKWGTRSIFKNRSLPKQQLNFHIPVENHNNSHFKPLSTSKPYRGWQAPNTVLPSTQGGDSAAGVSKGYICVKSPIDYLPFEPAQPVYIEYVDTEESVVMLEELNHLKEIAIDLEDHNDKLFIEFFCFKRKLAHGGNIALGGTYMDIIWLQGDFGLYIVGLFNLSKAARPLGFVGKVLAQKNVDFDADKKSHLTDWRIRPLPQKILDYARSDATSLTSSATRYSKDPPRLERSTPGS
ncbi:ribonuclease H-like domain-containing protein [Kalaharituber pfeilii]|nr:ribonuclease H-like domain-containing protein [Kalaharituber pfeilii]